MNRHCGRIKHDNKPFGSERHYTLQHNQQLMAKRKKLALFMNKGDEIAKAAGESERKIRKRPNLRSPVQVLNTLTPSDFKRQKKENTNPPTGGANSSSIVDRNVPLDESQKSSDKRRDLSAPKRPKNVKGILEESGSDSEGHLIDVSELSSSPAHRVLTSDKSIEDFDKIATEENNLYDKYIEEINGSKKLSDPDVDIVSGLCLGDILAAMESQKARIGEITFHQYKNCGYPEPPLSKRALLRKVEKFLPIVNNILKDKERTSYFFDYAHAQFKTSQHETMSKEEKWEVDWTKYFGGYYGLKRQLFIGEIIKYKCKEPLRIFSQKNEMASYWTINGFTNFILANELIVRMVMEDLNCDFERAQSTVRESVNYGLRYTDIHQFNDDLDIGEFFEDESRKLEDDNEPISLGDIQSSPSTDTTKPNFSHQEKDGSILDTFLYDSDE